MTRYYFTYYTKHAAFLGVEAASEEEARDLLERANEDYAFVGECMDLAESEEPCDMWAEWDGAHEEEGYGDADVTDLARERARALERARAKRKFMSRVRRDSEGREGIQSGVD